MIKIKITIDTKEDSHEEIRKIIRMLSSLVGEKEVLENRNIFESDDTPQNIFGNIFNQQSREEPKEGKEEEKTEIPEVIEYR